MDINDIITARFGPMSGIDASNADSFAFGLHVALTHAGLVTDQIYELAVHPAKGTVDDEAVAATARALLAHLGQMNSYVDALMSFTTSLRWAKNRPQDAATADRDTGAARGSYVAS